ncbi:hypothetical protein BpHYR1_000030 [Brachionus plicatilis]|uniref:Uncharacterized protein n=1 Tax=Brachionus plicatilis TaxID=10195 RepID=A0A3M7QJS6_BRAPC|nr:hypothetical protein BpHYR1_000030 [Brachionus plicatilis]
MQTGQLVVRLRIFSMLNLFGNFYVKLFRLFLALGPLTDIFGHIYDGLDTLIPVVKIVEELKSGLLHRLPGVAFFPHCQIGFGCRFDGAFQSARIGVFDCFVMLFVVVLVEHFLQLCLVVRAAAPISHSSSVLCTNSSIEIGSSSGISHRGVLAMSVRIASIRYATKSLALLRIRSKLCSACSTWSQNSSMLGETHVMLMQPGPKTWSNLASLGAIRCSNEDGIEFRIRLFSSIKNFNLS